VSKQSGGPVRGSSLDPVPIQILYVADRLLPRCATAFMDFIAGAFSGFPLFDARKPTN
jgi:LysR family transcriptional regulator, regulator for bpeEF and oprC